MLATGNTRVLFWCYFLYSHAHRCRRRRVAFIVGIFVLKEFLFCPKFCSVHSSTPSCKHPFDCLCRVVPLVSHNIESRRFYPSSTSSVSCTRFSRIVFDNFTMDHLNPNSGQSTNDEHSKSTPSRDVESTSRATNQANSESTPALDKEPASQVEAWRAALSRARNSSYIGPEPSTTWPSPLSLPHSRTTSGQSNVSSSSRLEVPKESTISQPQPFFNPESPSAISSLAPFFVPNIHIQLAEKKARAEELIQQRFPRMPKRLLYVRRASHTRGPVGPLERQELDLLDLKLFRRFEVELRKEMDKRGETWSANELHWKVARMWYHNFCKLKSSSLPPIFGVHNLKYSNLSFTNISRATSCPALSYSSLILFRT